MRVSQAKRLGAADQSRKRAMQFSCLKELHVGSQSEALDCLFDNRI
jgi:hypothetical protein